VGFSAPRVPYEKFAGHTGSNMRALWKLSVRACYYSMMSDCIIATRQPRFDSHFNDTIHHFGTRGADISLHLRCIFSGDPSPSPNPTLTQVRAWPAAPVRHRTLAGHHQTIGPKGCQPRIAALNLSNNHYLNVLDADVWTQSR